MFKLCEMFFSLLIWPYYFLILLKWQCFTKTGLHILKHACIPFDLIWSWWMIFLISCWIYFFANFFENFCIYIYQGYWCVYLFSGSVLFWLGIRVMLVSWNYPGKVISSLIFWKSLRIIGIKSKYLVNITRKRLLILCFLSKNFNYWFNFIIKNWYILTDYMQFSYPSLSILLAYSSY